MNSDNQPIDHVYKIYKNSSGRIIGIHEIVVFEDRYPNPTPIPGQIRDARFKRRGYTKLGFRRVNHNMVESRVIDTVKYFGRYDDFTVNGSNEDFTSVTYLGDDTTNSLIIPLTDLPTIGDTL